MTILRFVFILGFFPLEYCVVAPHPVLDCGYTEIGALALFIGAAFIILTGDREGMGGRYIFLSILPWLIAGLFVANWASTAPTKFATTQPLSTFTSGEVLIGSSFTRGVRAEARRKSV